MNIKEKNNISGLVLVDKPIGITSHKVVSVIKKQLSVDRVGHLGTLDPFASGLLPVLIGGSTRLSDEIMDGQKQYLFRISFGKETDTLDLTGQVILEKKVPLSYYKLVEQILPEFIGEIEQVPPMYSALKVNGRPLYEYMRATGKLPVDIETKKRHIKIFSIEVVNEETFTDNTILLRVLCGKGTYVRSLARDIANKIGTVGHCSELRREFVEPWNVKDAISFSIEEKPSFEHIVSSLIPPEKVIPHIPKLIAAPYHLKLLSSGNIIFISRDEFNDNLLANELQNNALRKKIFVEVEGSDILFLSEVEFIKEKLLFKIMPKKKIL